MKPAQLLLFPLLSLPVCQAQAADPGFDDTYNYGPPSHYEPPDAPRWREQATDLPAYPVDLDALLPLGVSSGGRPYTIYLDPASLSVGDDRVVRFTSVLISSSGVWNVTYEGLHCGEENHRRLAYGSNGSWHRLDNSPWTRIHGRGIHRYRKVLYHDYLCEHAGQIEAAEVLVRKLRNKDIFADVD